MITREQMIELGHNNLLDEFIGQYKFEYGEKKLNEIVPKVCDSKKILELLRQSYSRQTAPNSQEILTVLYSMGYFMFSKSETLCMGSLIFFTLWNNEVNKKLNIKSDTELSTLLTTIILECDKRKTHIRENFFSRYFIKLAQRYKQAVFGSVNVDNTLQGYLESISNLILQSNEFENLKGLEEKYTEELFEYRKFKAQIVASILYQLKAKEKLGELPNHIDGKIINSTQYLILSFYKTYIATDKLIINYLHNDNAIYKIEYGLVNLIVMGQGEYSDEIRDCLETGKAVWVEELENEETIDDEEFIGSDLYGTVITGINHYYRFIWEIFFIEIEL